MIKDRGNIKWTSLMLTEHREKLKELYERDKDIKKPLLDEQHLDRLDFLLGEALRLKANIEVLYYENRRLHYYQGRINLKANDLYLDDKKLQPANIVDITIM
ncbi:MAG: YolD-like family protein [Halanaerobiales bacterium]